MKLFFLFFVGGACFAALFSAVSSQPLETKPEVNGKPVLKSNGTDDKNCTTLGNPIVPIRNLFDAAMETELKTARCKPNEPFKVINILFEPILDGVYTFTYLTRPFFSGSETECKLKLFYDDQNSDSPFLLYNICDYHDNKLPFVLLEC
ncbi:uncharacterized protein [Halyomorpha halys]|uniref:uncharacterized protein isoform X3 n=1 Tax=Halyomorpha halys TaxID=286706 RepID=UPI0006D4F046|nr:uncharacterized protein LOC106686970 [Halyomorpha halys]